MNYNNVLCTRYKGDLLFDISIEKLVNECDDLLEWINSEEYGNDNN